MVNLKGYLSVTFAVTLGLLVMLQPSAVVAANSGKLSEEDKKVTAAYAQHIFTSTCASNYHGNFNTLKLKVNEVVELNKHTMSACRCMYDTLSQNIQSPEIIDYVMYVYGASPNPDKPTPKAMAYYNSPQIRGIGQTVSDAKNRKKCGFVK